MNYRLVLGRHTVAFDTGDGLASFRFFKLPIPYWNWFEGAGQPFWTELAVYRMQDPLMWPLILLAKNLSPDLIIQFNLYVLFRISLLSVGIYYLFRALNLSRMATQMGTIVATMGSTVSMALYSIGILDLLSAFVGISLFGLLYLQHQSRGFLILLTLMCLHASITYHIVYLLPLFLGVALIFREQRIGVFELLRRDFKWILRSVLLIAARLGAQWLAVTDRHLVPLLRSIFYNTEVDAAGKILSADGVGHGRSIFENSLKTPVEACGKLFHCAPHTFQHLKTFLHQGVFWSRTGFVTVVGLLLLLYSLSLFRERRIRVVWGLTLFCFALSLGHHFPFWSLAQSLLPPLQFLRHTGFYVSLYTLFLCLLIAYAWERQKHFRWLMVVLMLGELAYFNRYQMGRFLEFTTPTQHAELNTLHADTFKFRKFRLLNGYGAPRSSLGTAFGIPTVAEPLFVQDLHVTQTHQDRSDNPRFFGNINLFQSRPTTIARVHLDKETLSQAAGVFPYPLLTSNGDAYAVRFHGDSVEATLEVSTAREFYAAFSSEVLDQVLLNDRLLTFSSAQQFGVTFDVPPGIHTLRLVPQLGRRNAIYALYYGAYGTTLLWAVIYLCLALFQLVGTKAYTLGLRVPKGVVSPLQH